jgi:hypothetical protein
LQANAKSAQTIVQVDDQFVINTISAPPKLKSSVMHSKLPSAFTTTSTIACMGV